MKQDRNIKVWRSPEDPRGQMPQYAWYVADGRCFFHKRGEYPQGFYQIRSNITGFPGACTTLLYLHDVQPSLETDAQAFGRDGNTGLRQSVSLERALSNYETLTEGQRARVVIADVNAVTVLRFMRRNRERFGSVCELIATNRKFLQ